MAPASSVYNGLDWAGYGPVDFDRPRSHYHFPGKAAWGVKNVRGAIKVAKMAGVELDVLGGNRINFKRGFRWTLSRKIHFHGMVGGTQRPGLLNASRGLDLSGAARAVRAGGDRACTGCPVFSTPYGALPGWCPCTAACCQTRPRCWPRRCGATALMPAPATSMWWSTLAPSAWRATLRMYERVLAGETLNARPPMIQGLRANCPEAVKPP